MAFCFDLKYIGDLFGHRCRNYNLYRQLISTAWVIYVCSSLIEHFSTVPEATHFFFKLDYELYHEP